MEWKCTISGGCQHGENQYNNSISSWNFTFPFFWQIFPGAEGWPFPKYLGSCGRLIVTVSTRPLKEFYGSSSDVTADLALQLLTIINFMMNNDLNYFFYFTHVDADMFGVFSNGQLFIQNASMLGVIDKQEGTHSDAILNNMSQQVRI